MMDTDAVSRVGVHQSRSDRVPVQIQSQSKSHVLVSDYGNNHCTIMLYFVGSNKSNP